MRYIFFLNCPKYSHLRGELVSSCFNKNIMNTLNIDSQFIWMLSNEDTDVCRSIAKYLNLCFLLRPKKNICVFTVTCQKNLGLVGIFFILLLLSAKPEIVVPVSGIRFRHFIYEISSKMTNYAVFLPSLLSISTKS